MKLSAGISDTSNDLNLFFFGPENTTRPQLTSGAWDDELIFRPYQSVDSSMNLEPMMDPSDPDGSTTDWLNYIPRGVRGLRHHATEEVVSFPDELIPEDAGMYSKTPYSLAYTKLKRNADDFTYGGAVNQLIKGSSGKGAPFPKPTQIGFIQGALLKSGDKAFFNEPVLNCTFVMPSSMLSNITAFLIPDVLSKQISIFDSPTLGLHIQKSGKPEPQRPGMTVLAGQDDPGADGKGYTVRLVDFSGITQIPTIGEDANRANFGNWQTVLQPRLTAEKQMSYLRSVCPSALMAWLFASTEFEGLLNERETPFLGQQIPAQQLVHNPQSSGFAQPQQQGFAPQVPMAPQQAPFPAAPQQPAPPVQQQYEQAQAPVPAQPNEAPFEPNGAETQTDMNATTPTDADEMLAKLRQSRNEA